MGRRHGRITIARRDVDGGQEPNKYLGQVSVEIRIFAPPHTGSEDVQIALDEAYEAARADMLEDYSPSRSPRS